MSNASLWRSAFMLSPFGFEGGDFSRAQKDPRVLLSELHAEQEYVRNRQRQCRNEIKICESRIEELTHSEDKPPRDRSVPWLVSAAALLCFSLVLSISPSKSCFNSGLRYFLLIAAAVLFFRWLAEKRHVVKSRSGVTDRLVLCQKERDDLQSELYELNLRIAELDKSIQAVQRLL